MDGRKQRGFKKGADLGVVFGRLAYMAEVLSRAGSGKDVLGVLELHGRFEARKLATSSRVGVFKNQLLAVVSPRQRPEIFIHVVEECFALFKDLLGRVFVVGEKEGRDAAIKAGQMKGPTSEIGACAELPAFDDYDSDPAVLFALFLNQPMDNLLAASEFAHRKDRPGLDAGYPELLGREQSEVAAIKLLQHVKAD